MHVERDVSPGRNQLRGIQRPEVRGHAAGLVALFEPVAAAEDPERRIQHIGRQLSAPLKVPMHLLTAVPILVEPQTGTI